LGKAIALQQWPFFLANKWEKAVFVIFSGEILFTVLAKVMHSARNRPEIRDFSRAAGE